MPRAGDPISIFCFVPRIRIYLDEKRPSRGLAVLAVREWQVAFPDFIPQGGLPPHCGPVLSGDPLTLLPRRTALTCDKWQPSMDVRWLFEWSATIPHAGYLCCPAGIRWCALWWREDAWVFSRPLPLCFDNPPFRLRFHDGDFKSRCGMGPALRFKFSIPSQWRGTRRACRAYYGGMDNANLVVVHECGSEMEADLAKGALQAAGLDAIIQADTAGHQRDHIAWSGAGFKLLVREEDAVDAREVLAAPPLE